MANRRCGLLPSSKPSARNLGAFRLRRGQYVDVKHERVSVAVEQGLDDIAPRFGEEVDVGCTLRVSRRGGMIVHACILPYRSAVANRRFQARCCRCSTHYF